MTSPSHANQAYWDSDAANYHAEHPDYLSSFYWCPEMLHEDQAHLLGDVSASSVLEIGCGSAPCTEWLQSRAHFATGFDISRGMLNHAAPGLPRCTVTPLRDGLFRRSLLGVRRLPFSCQP